MICVVRFAILSCLIPAAALAATGENPASDLMSDTWVATDVLGRELPRHAECGPPRENKVVGIFYFLWLGQHGTGGPFDISKLLAANPDQPQWGPVQAFHHWGEPELGYYLSDDPYVIRRHCHMLVDAGVDVLIFDVTNAFTYDAIYTKVCSVLRQIRQEGGRTPQFCFITNSGSDSVVQRLYDSFYSKNLYSELWFRWQGKPLMLAKPDTLNATLRDFFTFRHSWAWSKTDWFGDGRDKWAWLDHYPQAYGWHEPNVPEEVPVCVAQHPTTNIGRSFHDGREPDTAQLKTAEGLCFAEQWRRALEIDPQFLFITGWNEWVAQRFLSDGQQTMLGRVVPAGGTFFVDQYNQEYSRDIEPMRDGHTDAYYYQLVANIRRYKGARAPESPSKPRTIAVDGQFDDWTDVRPEYRDTVADTVHRNHPGWGNAGTYVNTTGRNDFVRLKVSRDDEFIYFHGETRADITSHTQPNWMLLFIDADRRRDTGWEGYDYVANASVTSATTTTLKRIEAGGNWTTVAEVPYRVAGSKLELMVRRSDIGQDRQPGIAFDFHWADNIQKLNDIIEFSINGDSAPNRRFNYRYETAPSVAGDFDADGDVDQADFGWLQECCAGSFRHYPAACSDADLDTDGDVDGRDMTTFLACMGGPNEPPGC